MGQRKRTDGHVRDQAFLSLLGEHCRRLRVKRGFSVNRMASEGDRLSPSVILRLETGKGAVTVMTLMRYAEVLEVHPRRLLDFEFGDP